MKWPFSKAFSLREKRHEPDHPQDFQSLDRVARRRLGRDRFPSQPAAKRGRPMTIVAMIRSLFRRRPVVVTAHQRRTRSVRAFEAKTAQLAAELGRRNPLEAK